MSDVSEQVVVTRNEDEHRWEARIGDELAGFAAYQLTDELIVFTHTEVEPAFEGRGVGGALARHALDEVAEEGTRKVMPLCPFIKAWIARHPDYRPLVYGVSTGTDGALSGDGRRAARWGRVRRPRAVARPWPQTRWRGSGPSGR